MALVVARKEFLTAMALTGRRLHRRPRPASWLNRSEVDLKDCKKHYSAMYETRLGQADCPWCRIDDLEGSLKVLHTWASFDVTEGQQTALIPEHVVALCNKALKRKDDGRR